MRTKTDSLLEIHVLSPDAYREGFRLYECDDDFLDLFYKGDRIARFSQVGVEIANVHKVVKETLEQGDKTALPEIERK